MTEPAVKEDVDTSVNWDEGVVTFRTTSINGVQLINQPTVKVPLLLIARLGLDVLRIMMPPQFQRMNFMPRPAAFQPPIPPKS